MVTYNASVVVADAVDEERIEKALNSLCDGWWYDGHEWNCDIEGESDYDDFSGKYTYPVVTEYDIYKVLSECCDEFDVDISDEYVEW